LVEDHERTFTFSQAWIYCDDTQLIEEGDRFYALFERIENQARSFPANVDPQLIARFNSDVHAATCHIWAFKRKVLGLILSCRIGGLNFPLLVDHVSREAAYFMNRLEQLNTGTLDPLPDAIINENVFFLKIMADHKIYRTFAGSVRAQSGRASA